MGYGLLLAPGQWGSQRQGNGSEDLPESPWCTFAGILRKCCTDFVAACQQAWAEGPPIWKPLRAPPPLLQIACSQKTGGEVTQQQAGASCGAGGPLPFLCHSTPGPHLLPRLCAAGPCPGHAAELVPVTFSKIRVLGAPSPAPLPSSGLLT